MKKTISTSIFVVALITSPFTNCSEASKKYEQYKTIEGEYKATEAKAKKRATSTETTRINEVIKKFTPSAASYFAETKFERELREAQATQYIITRQIERTSSKK